MHLPFFDEIDLETPATHTVEADLWGRKTPFQLHIPTNGLSEDQAALIGQFLSDIDTMYQKAWKTIYDDYETQEAAREYVDYLYENLDKTDLKQILSASKYPKCAKRRQLASLLYVKKVFCNWDAETPFAFDFTISATLVNYVLAIRFARDGEVNDAVMES